MGVKRVKAGGRVKAKATPKKATPKKKPVAVKKEATPKVKPEPKANNVATPKLKPVRATKSKPAPKKKTPKKKPVSNNTPVKKEINSTTPSNDVPAEKKETRKRGAPKSENNVPAKKVAKEKPTAETPAAKTPARASRGRSAAKANNVLTSFSTPSIKLVASAAKATNNTDKKQSKAKPAKKSPAKAKRTAAPRTPKKPQSNDGKVESSAKVTKARASVGKRAKRTPATKTKSVLLNPVVEIEPLEHHYADIKQDITEDDSPQYNKQNIVARLPENNSSLNRLENDSVDETPSHRNSYESDWFNKKYKPYMEKIRNLTHDDISTFVKKNNKEYYEKIIDAQKPAKRNVNPDTKDLFKCNPFNSEQQLAMYLTLRQLFNVPETHFKQYKTFFTIIMPEISCQLFAQVFNVKVKSAPKLIKKLYPDPISPF